MCLPLKTVYASYSGTEHGVGFQEIWEMGSENAGDARDAQKRTDSSEAAVVWEAYLFTNFLA